MIACDLGSNTLRVVQFDCVSQQRIQTFERIIRTAKDLHRTGNISVESQERLFHALQEASLVFDFRHEPCFAVTTEAMRQASNAQAIIDAVYERFGVHFEIISGEEEAHLTALAVEHALRREGLDASSYVLFDLGGGSTELTFNHSDKKISKSFPFGIVSTAEQLQGEMPAFIEKQVSSMDDFIATFKPIEATYHQLVTTAGTPTTVAAFLEGLDYEHYDANVVNGKSLSQKDFLGAYEALMGMEPLEAECYTGTNRRDLVMAGILLVVEIMKKLGFESTIVIDDGLREGVAISNCNRLKLL